MLYDIYINTYIRMYIYIYTSIYLCTIIYYYIHMCFCDGLKIPRFDLLNLSARCGGVLEADSTARDQEPGDRNQARSKTCGYSTGGTQISGPSKPLDDHFSGISVAICWKNMFLQNFSGIFFFWKKHHHWRFSFFPKQFTVGVLNSLLNRCPALSR